MHDFSRSARRSVPADRPCGFIYLDYDAPAPLRGDRRDRGCLREASPTPAEVVPVGSDPAVEFQEQKAQVVGQHTAERARHVPLGSRVPPGAVPDGEQRKQTDHDAGDLDD